MAEPDSVARIFVLGGPDVGRSFEIRSRALLGRASDCEIRLHDRSISRHHARIEREGTSWVVVDQGSTNGVSKNGQRVARAELADCDEFLLGELPLRFRLGPAAEAPL
jgi:pSer/pThr/pTyr-binding forkhead associated (FHA) protein